MTSALVLIGGVSALYVVQFRNYLLFHGLVEVFSILVAFSVFILSWHAIEDIESPFIAVMGVSYLFIGGVDLLHTLAYKGMGVFPEAGADLPTQLWIFGRYVEAWSLLGAALLGFVAARRTSVDVQWDERTLSFLAAAYALVVGIGLSTVFVFDVFPTTYVEGSGLTSFKISSEYGIVGLLAITLALLYGFRERFATRVYQLLAASIVLTMGAELAFTFYVDVYGISNAVGHFFKMGSFYLVYLAVVKTGIRDPQKTLYREIARREAETRKFKKAADYSGHAIMITDAEGTIQYVNQSWEEMTGYSAAEATGRNPHILSSGEHDDRFYEEFWGTIQNGEVWEGEIINERKNGERFVISQTAAPIVGDDEEIQHFVAVNDDITEQKAYEAELESDLQRSVTQLQVLGRVLRHNIRNEMSVIIGNAETIAEDASDDVAQRASVIADEGNRVLEHAEKQREIVELLLEPSNRRPLSLAEVIESVSEELQRRHPEAAIAVEEFEDVQVRTLPEIEQALTEVVENAIVHSDREHPAVTIAVWSVDGRVEVRVEDDGPGIPAAEQRVISEDADISALLHSSGMGLWLVDQIVAKSGGVLHFDDADPRGSVVTLALPRASAEKKHVVNPPR
ncbi:PAS domain S-box-containing protein [Halobiforma haloterrestris]|uniref:histidine kinase n=1 Tax=Natronobacterium haloterrestre TaxID=148448 RepID=A0A1I1IBQ2_NATHA|nr:MASE3 domain-containing protein [Halobiforma haloterrestris]SFC33809.1 PAS domain S-box-containing protein [Halobiforma haloterrestris]